MGFHCSCEVLSYVLQGNFFSQVIIASFVLLVLPVVPRVTSKQHLINQEVCMQPILRRSMDVFQHDVGKST